MTEIQTTTCRRTAPLSNIYLLQEAIERVQNRAPHLPGIAVFYGPSGYGKSNSAAYAASQGRVIYVEAKSTWTKKALLLAIINELEEAPKNTIYEMVSQVAEQLAISGKVLIIDEADHIIDRKNIEIVRDIYEESQGSIILIGEEMLPSKLRAWERFHNRVLSWDAAQPASFEDALKLKEIYCPTIEVSDDLMAILLEASKNVVRRICVNIERVREFAHREGLSTVSVEDWKGEKFFTGEPPKRRAREA
ncbi:MAG: ATP-binding protein [Alphaproteobacteria bacterium]|nr:ATP-binding protein [Alphaproteobacteria bacterium]MDD9919752.1 ATP-binding protein [Alphaproteobacteria bacterium]